jgi:hemerythrin
MIIQWDKKMETGIPFLDADHMKLLAIINNIHHEITSPSSGKDELNKLFNDIILYSIYHFNNEETLFKQFGYPSSVNHQQSHDSFKLTIVEYHKSLLSGDIVVVSADIANFLVNWLFDHILEEDMMYKPFFLDRYHEVMKFSATLLLERNAR